MQVRTYSVLNDSLALARAAEQWMHTSPGIETPYREIARVWRSRGDAQRAINVLERGRKHVGRKDALALELGDAFAVTGDWRRVVQEWARAVGPRGEAFLLVQRRLANLPNGGALVIPGLVNALVAKPTTPERMRTAVQLAVDAGLKERALAVARALAPQLKPPERRGFMVELARRSDGAGLRSLALWSYGQIVSEGGKRELLLPVRSRMAELALSLGDTVQAERAYRELEGQLTPGSPERRQAMALRVQMLARARAFDSAHVELTRLIAESGEAAEADVAGATLANALIDAGRPDSAQTVLAGLAGPHARLARGRLYMNRGDAVRARDEVLAAAPQLDGGEATEALALATLLARLSERGGDLVGRAMAAITAGDRRQGIVLLTDSTHALPENERAALLDFAAGLADHSGLAADAAQIRKDIVEEAPRAPEAPLALLALARAALAQQERADARLLLERLLVEYPRSALVPQARSELDRLAAARSPS